MKTKFLLFSLAITVLNSHACMSDAACASLDSCCYMNRCTPSDSVECSTAKMDIFKALAQADIERGDVKEVVADIRS